MSTRMERAKMVRYVRWGTGKEKLRKADRKIAADGMHRVRFAGCALKRVETSFDLSISVEEAKRWSILRRYL